MSAVPLATYTPHRMHHILLLDDDPDELSLLEDAFRELNVPMHIQWFPDFDELCVYLAKAVVQPDMLFLDINMPRKTGLECLGDLKGDPRYSGVPVIVYTNSDHRPMIDECFALGAAGFVKKTISFSQLIANLAKILAWNLGRAGSATVSDRTLLN